MHSSYQGFRKLDLSLTKRSYYWAPIAWLDLKYLS